MNTFQKLSELQALVGSTLGTSEWQVIDQARIDQFAVVTGDDQWIHVDAVRAAAGPFRTTVAHGHLTLSLLPVMVRTAFKVGDVRMTINYGLNRVRFPAPVPVGSRLRGHFKLLTYETIAGARRSSWRSPRNSKVTQSRCAWPNRWLDISYKRRESVG
jgi:acyl dehydratase